MERLFFGILYKYDAGYVFTTYMSKMQSVNLTHKYGIRKMPLCSESNDAPNIFLGRLDLACKAFLLHMVRPGWASGPSCTCVVAR